jgi:hypothetical protein
MNEKDSIWNRIHDRFSIWENRDDDGIDRVDMATSQIADESTEIFIRYLQDMKTVKHFHLQEITAEELIMEMIKESSNY